MEYFVLYLLVAVDGFREMTASFLEVFGITSFALVFVFAIVCLLCYFEGSTNVTKHIIEHIAEDLNLPKSKRQSAFEQAVTAQIIRHYNLDTEGATTRYIAEIQPTTLRQLISARELFKKLLIASASIWIAMTSLNALTPTTKQVAFIIGGGQVYKMLSSEGARTISSSAFEIVEGLMKDYASQFKEKPASTPKDGSSGESVKADLAKDLSL
jgi:hypothetical protein